MTEVKKCCTFVLFGHRVYREAGDTLAVISHYIACTN